MGVTENGRLCCPFQFFPPVDQLMCWVARFWRRNPNPMRNTKSSTTVACGCRRSPPPVPCGTGVWATTAKTITSPLNALAKIKSETRWHKKQRESFCTANSRPTINHICAKYKKKREKRQTCGGLLTFILGRSYSELLAVRMWGLCRIRYGDRFVIINSISFFYFSFSFSSLTSFFFSSCHGHMILEVGRVFPQTFDVLS